MRHQSEDIAFAITYPGNIIVRTVWISRVRNVAVTIAITKDNALFVLEFFQGAIIANVITVSMSYWNAKHSALLQFIGERTISSLNTNKYMFADKVQITITDQSP